MRLTHLPAFVTGLIVVGLFGWNLSFHERRDGVLARGTQTPGGEHERLAALIPQDDPRTLGQLAEEAQLRSSAVVGDARAGSDRGPASGRASRVAGESTSRGAVSDAGWIGGWRESLGRPMTGASPASDGLAVRDYYPGGALHWIGSMHGGAREGRWLELSEEGELLAEGCFESDRRVGQWVRWHANGEKRDEGIYDMAGERCGEWSTWSERGSLTCRGRYEDGQPAGLFEEWYSNGEVRSRGRFADGLREGYWCFYDPDGDLDRRSGSYEAGARVR